MNSNNGWAVAELMKLERAIVDGLDRYEIYPLFPGKPKDTVGIKAIWTKKAMEKGNWRWLNRQSRQKYQQLMTNQVYFENDPTSSGTRSIRRDHLIGPGPTKKINGESAYIVEEIISAFEENGEWFFGIKWKGYGHEYNTEEPEDSIWDDVPDIVRVFYDFDKIYESGNIGELEGMEDSDDLEMSGLESVADGGQGYPSVTQTMKTSTPTRSTSLKQQFLVEGSLSLEQLSTYEDLDILFEKFLGQHNQQNTAEVELNLLQEFGRLAPDNLERECAPHFRSLRMDWNQEVNQAYASLVRAAANITAPGSVHQLRDPKHPIQDYREMEKALILTNSWEVITWILTNCKIPPTTVKPRYKDALGDD